MVLFCSLVDSLGGAEQLLFKLANFYKKQGKDVTICFFGKRTNSIWQEEGLCVHYSNGSFIDFMSYLKKQKRIDMVFSSHLIMNSILGFLRTLGVLKCNKLVCRESTSVFLRYRGLKLLKYKLAYLIGYRNIDLLITQSEEMKGELIKNQINLGNRLKIKSIPNLFEYPNNDVLLIKKCYPFIVSAGRLIPEKGFDILIKSFSQIVPLFPDFRLIILGEGPERSKLEKIILESNLVDNITLEGFVEDVYPYFKGASLCVVSSRIEGFPNVLLQMMSQNNNVVSTLCAGGIGVLKGINTCKTNDSDSLAMSMIKTIKSDNCENEVLFQKELNSRSIESFIEQINKELE